MVEQYLHNMFNVGMRQHISPCRPYLFMHKLSLLLLAIKETVIILIPVICLHRRKQNKSKQGCRYCYDLMVVYLMYHRSYLLSPDGPVDSTAGRGEYPRLPGTPGNGLHCRLMLRDGVEGPAAVSAHLPQLDDVVVATAGQKPPVRRPDQTANLLTDSAIALSQARIVLAGVGWGDFFEFLPWKGGIFKKQN